MSDSQKEQERIFSEAIKLPREQQVAFVQAECGPDDLLREEIELLLASHQQNEADDFILGRPSNAALGSDHAPIAEQEGDKIGRYRLLEQIGEGGMGLVYMAEQTETVRRRVALKIIKLGMDTRSVIARFEAERQAMALFDHPNITRVLDAGSTSTGRPYFVMELVRGVNIASYVAGEAMPLNERLKLFIDVCRAVHHAHQKGVIHRDLKPSNILVTQFDGVPVPKVIDFGIAKAIGHQQLTDKTLFTRFSAMVGTPQYMSPEQAEMTGLDIDTRADIYSLGVILYELLTGSTPLKPKELSNLNPLALAETLRDAEIETPSSRLQRIHRVNPEESTDEAPASPLVVNEDGIKGGLDWVVMKAIARDRRERYQSAIALAEDVERFLNGDPVQAAPPSKLYILKTLVRKYRTAAFSALTLTVILCLSVLICSLLAFSNYRTSQQLAESNESLSQTVTRLEAAERTIRATALREQYRSAISIALMKYEMELFSSSQQSIADTLSNSAEIGPDEDPINSAFYFAIVDLEPDELFEEIADLSRRNLLNSALKPIEEFINWASEEIPIEMNDGTFSTDMMDLASGTEVNAQSFEMVTFEDEQFEELLAERRRKGRLMRNRFYRHLVSEYRQVFGGDNSRVSEALNLLAACLIDDGETDEAEARLRESIIIAEEHDKRVARQLIKSLNRPGI